MLYTNSALFKRLSSIGYTNRNVWMSRNPGQKPLSTYAINNALAPAKDWNEIARKCSVNPNHKMYGKTVDEILIAWKTKSTTGQDRGLKLEDYIAHVLAQKPDEFDMSTFDENLVNKCSQFDKLYEGSLSKMMSIVGNEIWLNSADLGLSVRLDTMFETAERSCLIAEWKNTNVITMSNRFEKMIGPASHLDYSDINKITFQMQIYRRIIEDYGIFDNIHVRCFNIVENEYKIIKENFEYDRQFIDEIVQFVKSK